MPNIITHIDHPATDRPRAPWLHRTTAPVLGTLTLTAITLVNLLLGGIETAHEFLRNFWETRKTKAPAPVRRPRIATEPEDRFFDL